MGTKLGENLLANQERFHATTEQRYSELGLMGDRLGETLLANQERFQETTQERYAQLA